MPPPMTPSTEPASATEVLEVFAGRLGRAFRSARRDMWRLGCTEEHPDIFAAAAKTLQLCGCVLRPEHRGDLRHARRDTKELIEALVNIADTYGNAVIHGAPATVPTAASSTFSSNGTPATSQTSVSSSRDLLAETEASRFTLYDDDEVLDDTERHDSTHNESTGSACK